MGNNNSKAAYDSTSATIDLKEFKKPLQQLASDMDISLNWLVRKMLKDHAYLADYIAEKEKARKPERISVK